MNISTRRILMNALINKQFSCSPLVWMCHSRANKRKTNRLHERCLQIIYSDKQSPFETILEKDVFVSVHDQNIQILTIEMYKIKNGLSPLIVSELFEQRNEQHCDLRNKAQLTIPSIKTVYHGSESISFLGLKIWNILADRLKTPIAHKPLKCKYKIGSLKIVYVCFAMCMFKMSVLFKKFLFIKRKERNISRETVLGRVV